MKKITNSFLSREMKSNLTASMYFVIDVRDVKMEIKFVNRFDKQFMLNQNCEKNS